MGKKNNISIAIDGPAGSGKSTTAKKVAEALGFLHIDTGAMYRAITLYALENKIPIENSRQIADAASKIEIKFEIINGVKSVFLNNKDVTQEIRKPEVTADVSAVSKIKEVRKILVKEQQRLASKGGVVLEGRDIGTVVLKNAELKIFLIASVEERARRRKLELVEAGVDTSEDEIASQLELRDKLDSSREESPLKKADDAIILDTTNLTIDQQVDFVVKRAKEIMAEE